MSSSSAYYIHVNDILMDEKSSYPKNSLDASRNLILLCSWDKYSSLRAPVSDEYKVYCIRIRYSTRQSVHSGKTSLSIENQCRTRFSWREQSTFCIATRHHDVMWPCMMTSSPHVTMMSIFSIYYLASWCVGITCDCDAEIIGSPLGSRRTKWTPYSIAPILILKFWFGLKQYLFFKITYK